MKDRFSTPSRCGLLLAAAASLLAVGGGPAAADYLPPALADLAWIPDDAWGVVTVRVADVAKKLALDPRRSPMKELVAFEEAISLRIADVERCTVIVVPAPDLVPGGPGWGPVLLVRTSRPYNRKALEYGLDLPRNDFHFVDARTFLFGPRPAVSRCREGKKADERGPLAAVLSAADGHGVTAWAPAVRLQGNPAREPAMAQAFGLPLPLPAGVEWVAATLDMDRDARLAVRLSCRDEEAADAAAKLLREGVDSVRPLLLGIVRQGTAGAPPDAAEALVRLAEDGVRGVRIRTDGRAATIDVRVGTEAKQLGAIVQSLPWPAEDGKGRSAAPPAAPAPAVGANEGRTWLGPGRSAPPPPAPARAPCAGCGVEGTRKFTVANVRKEAALLFKEGEGGKLVFVCKLPAGETVDLETPVGLYWFAVFVEKPGGLSFTPENSGAVWLLREPKDDKNAAGSKVPTTTGKVGWRTDYQKARQEAREKGRPLLLLCGTSSCYWCDRLEEVIRKDADSSKLLQESLVPVKLSAAENRALFEALHIESYPTLVIASADGKILRRIDGFHEAENLNKEIREQLKKSRADPR